MIHYRIELADLAAHQYRVTLTVPQPAESLVLSLPVWIPGSYMVREFGRHLNQLEARQGRQPLALQQLDKTTWRLSPTGRGAVTVSYQAYAFDTSVRTAYLDDSRGFFNPTSLCLRVEGREAEPHQVSFGRLPKGWQVATGMPSDGEGGFLSADYDELVDHPFELGPFWRGAFVAGGVPHEFVVAGAWPGFDGERLLADAQRICATQIQFWHGRKKPPFSRYVFLLNAVEDGYGGLEHRASTALIANRRDLPRQGQDGQGDGYVTLLGLISHEYFHTWNVKRLKPASFLPYDLTRENYTELLWFFEGFTSYYDDLLLLRAGRIDAARYLKLISRTLELVSHTPGQRVQSLAEASFDAWVKYYRPDENTPNATVSYYTKGALLGLWLDLSLRLAGAGSLDELMRRLWARCLASGLTEDAVCDEVTQMAGPALAEALRQQVHARAPLPLEPLWAQVGLQHREDAQPLGTSLGLKLSEGPVSGVQIKAVLAGGPAAAAGLQAGDELLAVDDWRIRRLEEALAWLVPGQPFELTLVRQQRLRRFRVDPGVGPAALRHKPVLSLDPKAGAGALAVRKAWLGV